MYEDRKERKGRWKEGDGERGEASENMKWEDKREREREEKTKKNTDEEEKTKEEIK